MLVFIEVEMPNPRALSKMRNYVQKWRPLRLALPFAELDALGVARGPKFDKIIEQFFELQLRGKARTPEDRLKALKNFAGIKDEPKKKEKEEKKKAKGKEAPAKTAEGKEAKGAKSQPAPEGQASAAKPSAVEKSAPAGAKTHRPAGRHAAHPKPKPHGAKKARR